MTLKQKIGRWIYSHLPCSRRTFNVLRFEWHAARQRWLNRVLPWRIAHIRKLRKMDDISLNVGSGGLGLAGWINFDAVAHHPGIYCTQDLRRPLPLRDCSVKRILAEHVVEHLDFNDDIPRVFSEFYRVLQPGSVLRIVVPDTRRFMKAYLNKDEREWEALGLADGLPADMSTPIELINNVFHQGGEHHFGWDFEAMNHALKQAGFSRVIAQSFGQSLDPGLAVDQAVHAPYSLYVEGVK